MTTRALRTALGACGVLLLHLLAPREASAWGLLLHQEINRAAATMVPDDMAAWRAYADLLGRHGADPDFWKETDPDEGPRHYLDFEAFGKGSISELDRDQPCVVLEHGQSRTDPRGTVPWTIRDVQARLTEAMRRQDWVEAAHLAAALGHYVGDSHQPLHCTENHDGQHSGNHGVHLRWEVDMANRRWKPEMMQTAGAEVIPDVWVATCAWMDQAYANLGTILAADRIARESAEGNLESGRYYRALWKESGELMRQQVNRAAANLASLFYTAWVEAGRPPIPPPPEEIPSTTIHPPLPLNPSGALPKSSANLTLIPVVTGVVLVLTIGIATKRHKDSQRNYSR